MKICSSCGFKVLDNQKYCPRCGLPINSKPLANTQEKIISDDKKTSVENQRKLNIDNKKKNHSNKPIMIICIIAIITLAGVILFSAILNKERKKENDDAELKNIITSLKN